MDYISPFKKKNLEVDDLNSFPKVLIHYNYPNIDSVLFIYIKLF